MSDTLHIPVAGVYFDQIAAGTKPEEYRLRSEHWRKRLEGRSYKRLVLTRGYPKNGGVEGRTRLTLPWCGWATKTITHPHFGPEPVEVYAIRVTPTADDFDNMHHALGRPETVGSDTYRNYFCTAAGGDLAERFELLGWWDFGRRINEGRDAIYHVNGAGKQALTEWMRARDSGSRPSGSRPERARCEARQSGGEAASPKS